jgi:tRNA pseudouridine38-40 synthase
MSQSSLLLVVEYDGTRYHGFQRQSSTTLKPSKRPRILDDGRKKSEMCTIQDCLEDAIMQWQPETTQSSLRLRAAGRTDKGVHAKGQIVVVDICVDQEDWMVIKSINSRLPYDISVRSISYCSHKLEPRHACTKKAYSYTIRFRRLIRDHSGQPISICRNGGPHSFRSAHDPPCLWVCPWALDDSLFQSICNQLTGEHDFSSFLHKSERSNHASENKDRHRKTLDTFRVSLPFIISEDVAVPIVIAQFQLEARSFGRSMIRNLVGFVVDISRGKLPYDKVVQDIWTSVKPDMIHAAPASGLCLDRVWLDTTNVEVE